MFNKDEIAMLQDKYQISAKPNPFRTLVATVLILAPAVALVIFFVQKKYFIPPVDFKSFLFYSVKVSTLACFVLFILTYWKSKITAGIVMVLIFAEVYWFFGGLLLLPIVNVKYDRSDSTMFEKKVLQLERNGSSRYVRVESWGNRDEWLKIPRYMYERAQPLKTSMRFSSRRGCLGFEYVTSLELVENIVNTH